MRERAVAVMIYPCFSLQEITCLTSYLTIRHEYRMDVFASAREAVRSEDGFLVGPDYTFESFDPERYDALILPGIIDPMPALFDGRNIDFLRGLGDGGLVVAAISSAPLLLAKAGLLDSRRFTCGLFEEVIQYLGFIPRENLVREPVHQDGKLITAVGFAFREFAVQTMRAMGIACRDDLFAGVSHPYTAEELTVRMGEENFQAFLEEYAAWEKGGPPGR